MSSTSVIEQVLGFALPAGGFTAADYAVGGVYGCYASILGVVGAKAYFRKLTIKSAYINLYFFALARCVGYILRGISDDEQPSLNWSNHQWTQYVAILTSAYAIITAGTTIFLFFMSVMTVHFRRSCYASRPLDDSPSEEVRQRKEDRLLIFFRIFVLALAVIAAIGCVREFDYYWFNFTQGRTMRQFVAIVQVIVTLAMVSFVTLSYMSYGSPLRARRAYILLNLIFVLMLITQAVNLARVFTSLTSPVNSEPNITYCLVVLPELLLLSIILLGKFTWAFDYVGIAMEYSNVPMRKAGMVDYV